MEATMQTSLKALLVGAAAAATVFAVTPAVAGDRQDHILAIPLPGGGVEEIHYTGDVAPQIVLVPTSVPSVAWAGAPSFAPDPLFSMIERISAAFDQQAADMLRQVREMPAVTAASLQPGETGYSMVSTFSSDGVCTQTTQITYMGNGIKPRTVSSTSGKCGPGHDANLPANLHFTPPNAGEHAPPKTLEVKATGAKPYSGLLHEAYWQQPGPKAD